MIPSDLQTLFWDTNLDTFTPEAYPDYTIFRVLEYGDDAAIAWLRETFSESEILRVLIVLSDFLEDDGARDFATSRELRNAAAAKTLARELAHGQHLPPSVRVFLGSLRSTELKHLGRQCWVAIIVFWEEYFSALGSEPAFAVDGPHVAATLPMLHAE